MARKRLLVRRHALGHNSGMRPATQLVWLLLLAMGLVDLAVLAAARDAGGFPSLLFVCAWALALSQISLAAIWVAWGRAWLPGRAPFAVLVVVVWSRALADLPSSYPLEQWLALNGLHLLLAGALTAIAPRTLGYAVAWPGSGADQVPAESKAATEGAGESAGSDQSPRQAAAEPGRYQFSILYLLLCMTSLAVILGLLKVAVEEPRRLVEMATGPQAFRFVVPFALLRMVVAGVVLWIVLGRGRVVLKLVCLLVMQGMSCLLMACGALRAVSVATALGVPPPRIEWWELAWIPLLHLGEAGLLAGYLVVLRMAGLRLVRSGGQVAGEQSQTAGQDSSTPDRPD